MSFNYLDSVKDFFSGYIVTKASEYLGESQPNIRKGLDTVIPVSLAGIAKTAEEGKVESILSMAREAFDSGILNNLGDTFSSSGGGIPAMGPSLITSILGDKFGAVANAVSSFTGLKGSSTSSLFGSVVPLALALLGRYVKDNNAAPGAISSLLSGQKNAIWSALPAGFDLSKYLGVSTPSVPVPPPQKSGNKWLLPLLLILAGILLLWWLMRSCNGKEAESTTATTDTVVVTKTDTLTVTQEPMKVTLPNGVILQAYKGGMEDLLVAFLSDSSAQPGKDNWFDFNDVNFKFGTDEILPESAPQLHNIVEILRAFPNVKVKVGGYTDKVGDETANMKLSQDRADAILNALTDAGVGSQLTGAEGYGSEFAKYPASAPEENRVKDRRVSLSVREK